MDRRRGEERREEERTGEERSKHLKDEENKTLYPVCEQGSCDKC